MNKETALIPNANFSLFSVWTVVEQICWSSYYPSIRASGQRRARLLIILGSGSLPSRQKRESQSHGPQVFENENSDMMCSINLDFAASHEMSAWHKQPAAAPVQPPPQKAYQTQQAYQSQQAHHAQQIYQPQQPYVAYQSGYGNQQRGHGQGYQQQSANATRHNPAMNPYASSQVANAQGYNPQPYMQAQGLSNMPPCADAYGGVNPYGASVAYNNVPLPPSNMAYNGQSSFNGRGGLTGGGGQQYSLSHQPYLPPGPPSMMHTNVNRPSRPPPPTNSGGRPLAAAPFPLAGGGGGGGMKTFAPPPPFSLAGGGGGRGRMPPTMKRPPSDSRRDLGGDHKRQRTEAPLPYD